MGLFPQSKRTRRAWCRLPLVSVRARYTVLHFILGCNNGSGDSTRSQGEEAKFALTKSPPFFDFESLAPVLDTPRRGILSHHAHVVKWDPKPLDDNLRGLSPGTFDIYFGPGS